MSLPDPLLHTIGAGEAEQRVDHLLRALTSGLSRLQARDLCELGAVALDGVRAASRQRALVGQRLQWLPQFAELSLRLRLSVVHDADGAIVVQKLPGLASHRGTLVDDNVADRLAQVIPGSGLAHRLDRPTSGLLLCGRDAATLASLTEAMHAGAIEREYLAVAVGVVDDDVRTIDLPLRSTDQPMGNLPKVVVDDDGDAAVTHLEVVARGRQFTLVRLRLETGRTHQIRAHLRAIGHPLLGDPRYGDAEHNEQAHRTHGIDRPLLHADRLLFPAPDGRRQEVRAIAEPDMVRLFPQLRG